MGETAVFPKRESTINEFGVHCSGIWGAQTVEVWFLFGKCEFYWMAIIPP